jgi:hypothetical protein
MGKWFEFETLDFIRHEQHCFGIILDKTGNKRLNIDGIIVTQQLR